MKELSRNELKNVMGGLSSSCSASAKCSKGSSVSCSGKNSCVGIDDDGVSCDGTVTHCAS